MTYSLAVATQPTVEPVTIDEAKAHLRVDHADEDALIHGLIRAAREYVENVTARTLITTTYDLSLPAFPSCGYIEFPRSPVQSVTSVTYRDSAGASTTWGTSNYLVDTAGLVGRLVPAYGVSWPSFTAYPVNPVTVRFVAGYGAAGDVPEQLRQAMLLYLTHLYENRSATGGASNAVREIDLGVRALLAQYRVHTF